MCTYHLQNLCNVVHHTDRGPAAVLSLTKVQERNDGGLFVLGRIVRNDLFDFFHVVLGELERNVRIAAANNGQHEQQ